MAHLPDLRLIYGRAVRRIRHIGANRSLAFLVAAGSSLSPQAWAAEVGRPVSPVLNAAMCSGATALAPLWAAGLYDAQVEGRRLQLPYGRKWTQDDLEKKARSLARLRRFGSYAAGVCGSGDQGWIAAFPAPATLAQHKGRIALPRAALDERCASYRADFAGAAAGQPRPLPTAGGVLDATHLGDGVVSVTCQPKAPRWQGPVLWYLLPTGKGPLATAPAAGDVAAAPGTLPTSLTTWINRVRSASGLGAVAAKTDLNAAASLLTVDDSLTHDRNLLQKTKDTLAGTPGQEFLGENRVRAADFAAMAWLLWNSPRHRSLLLEPAATSIGIAVRPVGVEQLAVLVFASGKPLATATGPARTPAVAR